MYVRLLTTSPKGLFSAAITKKRIKIKTYTNYLKLQLQIIRISFLPLYIVYSLFILAFALCFVLFKRKKLVFPCFVIFYNCPRLLKVLGK